MKPWNGTRETRTLTVLARIEDGRVDEVRDTLHEIRPGKSPFAQLTGVHFARLLVLDSLVHQVRPTVWRPAARLLDLLTHGRRREQRPDPLPDPYLLFSAVLDRQRPDRAETYVETLRGLGEKADAIWGACVDYPGHRDADGFRRFFRDRSLAPDYVFTAAAGGPVGDIRRAMLLRQRVSEFAAQTQDLSDEELSARFQPFFADLLSAPPAAHPTAPVRVTPPARQPGRVSTATPATDLQLDDIQRIVLRGYRDHLASVHLYLRITSPAANRWLSEAAGRISSAAVGREHAEPALHVALSHAGLARLGVPEGELRALPEEFRQGMRDREAVLAPGAGPQPWQSPFDSAGAVHALLMLSAADRAALAEWTARIRGELEHAGLEVVGTQHGDRIAAPGGEPGRFIEHFGFVDGLSRPGVAGYDPGNIGDALPAGEFVLGYPDVDGDLAGRGMPAELVRNGSFLVYRKLEQHVTAFRRLAGSLGVRFPGGAAQASAKLIGRWPDGTPLVLSPDAQDPALARESSFRYGEDTDGRRCPVGAHVRRGNPRDALPGGIALTRRHHMLRRGITYGPYLPPDVTDDGAGERGLLFLALMGDIGRQFELVQTQWMADGNVFGLGDQQDVLATDAVGDARVTVPGSPPTFAPVTTPLVTCRGGEYFLVPGLASLRRLGGLG